MKQRIVMIFYIYIWSDVKDDTLQYLELFY
jgi:hypothetical protein